jgi:phenylpyruvate tautomerase PptA (4-oxalocrotonate tautomerase family)
MPLLRISVPESVSNEKIQSISDEIHAALIETIDIPKDDRFHIVTKHSADTLIFNPNFLTSQPRSKIILIQIFLRLGRTIHQKRNLYAKVNSRVAAVSGFPPSEIMIVLSENDLEDWSFADGKAQYIDDASLFASRTKPATGDKN